MAYVIIGLLQVVLDSCVFIGLTAMGVPVIAANIVGRIVGASAGFVLNGRITFAQAGGASGIRNKAARFVLLWSVLTALGSAVLWLVERRFGMELAWLCKPMLEAVLAVFAFAGLKFYVFRPGQANLPTTK